MTDTKLTDRQLSLLVDLVALEDAGMIKRDNWAYFYNSDDCEQTIDLPPTVTDRGRETVKEIIETRKVLKL